jgi:hypothetical protein
MAKYAEQNSARLKSYMLEYRNEHKDRLNQRFYDRLKNDTCFKIRHAIRTRINRIIKDQKMRKAAHNAIGCTWKQLKEHIESQFLDGMTWENHGQWHIDHIYPLSKFDLTDPEQVARAQHYTNLRPLWALDNIAKGNRIECSQECPTPRTGDDVR